MKACELAALLARHAERVAKELLPAGRRQGHEWIVGDLDGSEGESLKVHLDGPKAGVWKDFATDESGDLIGLWMAVKGVNLHTACEQVEQDLGVVKPKLPPAPKVWATPSRKGVTPLTGIALDWLRSVRKIPEASIRAYRLASHGGEIMFPSLVDGKLVAAKYRRLTQKKFRVDANCQPVLFGWQAISPEARSITLTEGEADALALHAYGFPALSVPFGGGSGGKQQWIEHEYERLSVYDTIYLCLDNDEAGYEARAEIAKRLGPERCAVVVLPKKDANDCLMAGIEAEQIAQCFAAASTMDPAHLKAAETFIEAVVDEFALLESAEAGIRLPWPKVQDRLLLRAGETSLWAGINGHGKSLVVQQIVLSAMADDYRCCAASLEFLPHKWLRRLVRQASANELPNRPRIVNTMQAMRERLWLYSCSGSAQLDDILDVFAYAAKRYGVQLFLIDNFAKLSIAEDDYQAHKLFMDRISDFARDLNVHVMVVAHTRKTERGENQPPEKGDVKGSGALTDLADTVVAIWRNKPKEQAIEHGADTPDLRSKPDCLLVTHKQRNGESEPMIRLWFDLSSQQYVEEYGMFPAPMLGTVGVKS